MEIRNIETLKWLKKRIAKKTGVTPKVAEEMLGCIADLTWDYRKTKYDLYGLDLMNVLEELGEERCPDLELL